MSSTKFFPLRRLMEGRFVRESARRPSRVCGTVTRREGVGGRVSRSTGRTTAKTARKNFNVPSTFGAAAALESRGPTQFRRRPGVLIAAVLLLVADAFGAEVTFAHRLGWKSSDVVVILHVDDVGMSHSSNLGAIEAIEKGVATSWSVMMPCPWVPEIAHYLKAHPDVDSGLHLTLNSEWASYRWGPLAGKAQVPGLVDREGCLWPNVGQVTRNATPDEIETEIRAQIDRAETLGIPITHLDSHMGTLLARSDYFERLVKIGVEKQIPILCVGSHMTHARQGHRETATRLQPWVKKIWNAGLPVIDDIHTDSYGWKPEEKTEKLLALLQELQPGITEILFHASLPTDDFQVITDSSESRHADLKALADPGVKKLVRERGIILTTWRELKERRKNAAAME